jgi:hypothetical protein
VITYARHLVDNDRELRCHLQGCVHVVCMVYVEYVSKGP